MLIIWKMYGSYFKTSLYEISESIKAPASLQSLTRDIFPELVLSGSVYTQNVCNTVHVRHLSKSTPKFRINYLKKYSLPSSIPLLTNS